MHMADALISPAVGGAMWAASAGLIAYCSRKVRTELDDRKVPLMGVLGSFVFAAQMINFSIPGTGSSGHLGGGLLLAVLLGPHAAFLTIASVLVVQALFFADGGLLALGCNIFNLGFFPAFIAYPLVYKKIAGSHRHRARTTVAGMLAAAAGLQLGAFGVVLETLLSCISSLPLATFALFMQPIHLAIGLVEGAVTVGIVFFILKARPDILDKEIGNAPARSFSLRSMTAALLLAGLLTGGVLSWLASAKPDGLEWSIAKVTGSEGQGAQAGRAHAALAWLQEKTSFLPDYAFKKCPSDKTVESKNPEAADGETSLAGFIGGMLTLAVAFITGAALKRRKKKGLPQH